MQGQTGTLEKLLSLIERYTQDLAVLRASQFDPEIAAILSVDIGELMRLDQGHVKGVAYELSELVISHSRLALCAMNRQLSIARSGPPIEVPDALLMDVRTAAIRLDRAARILLSR